MRDIHDYPGRYSLMRAAVEKSHLDKASKSLVLEFDALLAAKRFSLPRRIKYLEILRLVGVAIGKPLNKVSRDDLMRFFGDLDARPLSAWTKNTYAVLVKRFWKWLKGLEGMKDYPPEVSWIPGTIPRSQVPLLRPEVLPDEKDVVAMLRATKHPRDRAFISVLWETGARIGELGNLLVRDVVFDDVGGMLNVVGKTGARRVRILQSVPDVSNWLSIHPLREQADAPLWVTMSNNSRGKPIAYPAMRKFLREAAARAEVKKRVNPHAFRHARASHLANHLTEFQMNHYLGWVQGSGMPGTYVHLSGKDTDNALLKLNGLKPKDEDNRQSELKPRVCVRCTTLNQPDGRFCRKCGGGLELAATLRAESERRESEELMALVLKDADVQKVVQEALLKLKLKQPLT